MKPLLLNLSNNYEFVSFEMEGLNNLIVELQAAHDFYVDSLENESCIEIAISWYEGHDEGVFKFKQSVCNYLIQAKRNQLAELNSVVSNRTHCSRKSNHARCSNLSTSSKSKLNEAETKVSILEVDEAFLKEKQASKMAAGELQSKRIAKAKREEITVFMTK